MGLILTFFTTILLNTISFASQAKLILVPAGKIEAIWQESEQSAKGSKEKVELQKPPVVSVESFYSMERQVTVKEFKDFLISHPEWNKKIANPLFVDQHYLVEMEKGKDEQPITNVSWHAARAFCQSQDLRLPTISEWEYMAAASEYKANASKDEKFLRRILDWYGEPKGSLLKNAGTLYKNKYGVWDLHGLVWEWVDDFNSILLTGESRGDGSLNKNLFCGNGSQISGDKSNYAAFMRFAFRSSLKGSSSTWNLGFRCVRSL